MYQASFLTTALCLPASDIEALAQGRTIAAFAETFIRAGQQFALYPQDNALLSLLTESQQLSLSLSKQNQQLSVATVSVSVWAKAEQCQILDQPFPVEKLANLTQWTRDELQSVFQNKQHLFLVYLRVFRFPQMVEVLADLADASKTGKFIGLPDSQSISEMLPVLDDCTFAHRKRKLENLEPPDHPEIEKLLDTIAQLTPTNPSTIHLEQDLKCFLGWAESAIVDRPNTDSQWIQDIAKVGNSSDGDRFEKLVRRSFVELGFQNSLNNPKASLDPNAAGGAGGIDIYCDTPYSLVGECKASKHEKVPNSVSAQLIHLGQTHLGKAQFDCSIKVLFVAGRLTDAAEKAAVEGEMNVMRPETLERLVTIKAHYPGAINLFELEDCLQVSPFGEASDEKINGYLDRIQEDLKVRSKIVEILQAQAPQDLGIDFIWGAYQASHPPRPLKQEQIKEILIELSSPLTGFIGRKDGDRFYFLRSFHLNTKS